MAQLHLALFYENDGEYLDGIVRFLGPALEAGEPVAVALPPDRVRALRARLNGAAAKVTILDMAELGGNPARIIPAVEGMLAEHENGHLHYVGEPIWSGRSPDEIREATKHEALINLAWPGARISVLCPYDVSALSPEVLADAERTHPFVMRGGEIAESEAYDGPVIPLGCDQSLADPPEHARSLEFGRHDLSRVRTQVTEVAGGTRLAAERKEDLLLVATELCTNAIRHGRGTGTLQVWSDPGEVLCQVEDHGEIADPLAGRRRPVPLATGGLGLWLVNQLCDLVEVRTGKAGTTVRAHVAL